MATNNLKNTKIQLGFIAIFTVPSFIIEAIFTNSMIVSLIKMFGISGILLILFLVLPKLKKILIYIMLLLNFALIFFLFYEMDVLPEIYEMESICDYIFLYMFIFLSYQQLAFTLPWTFQAFSIVGGFLYLLLKLKSFELNGSFCIILFIMWFSIINLYLREKGDRERFYELQAATSLVDKYQYLLKEVDPGINILLKQTREKGTKQGKRLFSSFVKEKIKNKSPEKKLFDIEYINSWAQSHYRLNSLAKVMDFFEQIYITENPDAEKEASNISKNIKGYLEEIINPFNNMQMGFDCSPTKQFLCVKKEMCESHVKEKQFSVIFCVYEWKSDIYILVRLNDFHLEEEVEKLKELDRFKDQLLANITHDLRTPLNGMIYFIKQAKEVKLDDNELNKLLNYAEINGNLLMNLIGDILDRSLLKANKMRLNVQKFCLKPVLDEIMILLQPKAEFQSIKLNLLYLCREELIVESDSDRLKQVLINLVSNAIKFTKKGFVRLRVYKKSERFLYFEVIDTGIGISKDDIRRLGTPFNSYDTHGVNGRGIGLGLSISKEIIGKLGPSAHLHISSKMGLGSKFAFKIYRSLVLKESVGAQKRKSLIKSFQKNEFKFTFEKLSIRNQNTDLSGDIEFSENNINEPMGRIDEEFSEVDSTDLQIESQISMNFDSEAIDEKIKKNEDLSPFKVKTFFDKKPKKQTMLQLNNTKSPKKDIRNIPPQKKLMNLINERGSPLKILIVDDNLFNILIMEKYLKKLSFDKENSKIINEFAHNGEIAVEKFKLTNKPSSESYFSLIIMDCEMPIMNGFEASTLIVKLIEEEKYRKCEILAYSALNLDSEVNKCKEHGMRYFLCKPCTENELFGTMYRALKTAEAEEETGDNLQILKQTSLAGGL